MQAFKFHLQEGQEILIQVPDGLEVKRDEVFALAALEAQDQIANGNIKVTKRIWPCFFCNTEYEEQVELLRHLYSHETLEKKLKEKLVHLYKKPEESILPTKTPSVPVPIPQPHPLSNPQVNYEETVGYRVRQMRSSLGESQAQFAKHFNIIQTLVSQWETNKVRPPKEVLEWQPTPSSVSEAEHSQELVGNAKN